MKAELICWMESHHRNEEDGAEEVAEVEPLATMPENDVPNLVTENEAELKNKSFF